MNAGQMSMMMQTPAGAGLTVAASASSPVQTVPGGEQGAGVFAGVLGGMMAQVPAQPVDMAGAVSVENQTKPETAAEVLFTVLSDMKAGTILTFEMPAVQALEMVSAGVEPAEQPEEDGELKQPEALMPQEVALSAAGAQVALTPQMNGRMPESDQKVKVQGDEAGVKASTLNTAATANGIQRPIPEACCTPEVEKAVSAPVAAETPAVPADVERLAAVTASRATAAPPRETALTAAAQNVPRSNQGIETDEVPAERKAEPAVPKIAMQQFMEAYSRPGVTVSNAPAATQVEIQHGQRVDVIRSVQADAAENNIAEVLLSSAQGQGAQKPTPMPLLAVMPEEPQAESPATPVLRAVETGAIPARAVVRVADDLPVPKEERLQQQATTASVAKTASMAENVLSGAVKAASSATAGGESHGGDRPMSDQVLNGQPTQVLQQHVKTENAVAPGSSAAPLQDVTTRSAVSEHVARQVGEHLANRDIKAGSEQIVIRLSPEHLGDLTLNMRMENQRLSVEILTDNRMVRDALLQNSDTLKDSLAKQNIKMDSFDVSTGGNNGGSAGRDQGDWRELARQRQNNAWMPAGGYRLPDRAAISTPPAYLAKSTHKMVDLHF
ncbi:MAG: flagellar hook-length control protein FliK [Deltaproteobacteria bacterium]|nr:flagellar hook-length control protein FliK [Deltaproteobacteria bacterium]